MSKRIRFKIDVLFPTNSRVGLAATYLNLGEVEKKARFEHAIACLYAPLGAAVAECSLSEVEKQIEISRNQFETFMQVALNRCALEDDSCNDSQRIPDYQSSHNGNGHHPSFDPVPVVQSSSSELEDFTDFDNEQL